MADQVTARGYRIVAKIYTNKQLEKFLTTCIDNESWVMFFLWCVTSTRFLILFFRRGV